MNDVVSKIISFETGTMQEDDIIPFFQELYDAGLAYNLQGSYGRMTNDLIRAGLIDTDRPVRVNKGRDDDK